MQEDDAWLEKNCDIVIEVDKNWSFDEGIAI